MPTYRLTPNRIIALSNLLRYHQADGVIRIEECYDDRFFLGDGPRSMTGRRTMVSIELEVYGAGLEFLIEDGLVGPALPAVPAKPVVPPQDYREIIELFVEIVKIIVRAWAMDDNKIRFGLLELD